MFNLIVGLMLYSFWTSLIGIGSILLLMRLLIVYRDKLKLKQALYVILIPCSIGYYLTYQEKSKFKMIYQVFVVLEFVLMLIGSVMIFYGRYL